MKYKLNPIASALGITLAATIATAPIAQADQNPFGVSEMSDGYMLAGAEGQCGGDMKKENDKESKSGDDMKKEKEGQCGGDMKKEKDKDKEGKCGEGKCGEDKE